MNISQAIERPFGISVFGSAIVRVEPDIASLNFAVTRLQQHPRDAFKKAHEGAQSVAAFLTTAKMTDVSSSRVALTSTFEYTGGNSRFIGYTALIAFNVLLQNLDQMEDILAGVVDAGINEIGTIDLQTSRLKEIRAEARRRAVGAAREKAEIYCAAAGINLGPVTHIEDVNPDMLKYRSGHVTQETQPDDEGTLQAFNPGSIAVAGAVIIAFEIGR